MTGKTGTEQTNRLWSVLCFFELLGNFQQTQIDLKDLFREDSL